MVKLYRYILIAGIFFLISCASAQTLHPYLYRGGGKYPYYYGDVYGKSIFERRYFQEARQYVGNLAAVCPDGKWGFIDKKGQTIIEFEYDWCSSFGEYGFDQNVAIVKNGTQQEIIPISTSCPTALINTKGELITPFYGYLEPISYELAVVNPGKELHMIGPELCAFDDKWGLIDKKGREIVPCIYDLIYPLSCPPVTFIQQRGKWGVINERGKLLIPCQYDNGYYDTGDKIIDTYAQTHNFRRITPDSTRKNKIIYMIKDDQIEYFTPKGKRIKADK